jgi:quinolinate synthase
MPQIKTHINIIPTNTFSQFALKKESERLFEHLKNNGWKLPDCQLIAPITLEINQLKKKQNAIILAHSYQTPDIMYGVADYIGDSYGLSKIASETNAQAIIFCSVEFMGETAKILNPNKKVLVPSKAGCSLADSITAQDVRDLKTKHPGVPVICYVNTSAEVKAESDICCTSSNVYNIIRNLPQQEIIFIPDKLMAANLQKEFPLQEARGKRIITWTGTCIVHEQFTPSSVEVVRQQYPGVKVLAHPECTQEVASKADFVGSTSAMLEFIKEHKHEEEVNNILSPAKGRCRTEAAGYKEQCQTVNNESPEYKGLRQRGPGRARRRFPTEEPCQNKQPKHQKREKIAQMRTTEGSKTPFMIISECGLTDRIKSENPDKIIVGTCAMCPYMKQIQLKDILKCLADPSPDQEIKIDPAVLKKAQKTFEQMYKWEKTKAKTSCSSFLSSSPS